MRSAPFLLSCSSALLAAFVGAASAQPAVSATVEAAGDTVVFTGRIDDVSGAAFLRLAQEPGIKRLVITSHGGLVAPALDMAAAIHERRLDVEVPTACLSSCANYIFPAGRRKLLGHAGAVGWHGNMTHVLYLEQAGRASWSESLMQEARQLARREAEFYRRIGVDGFVSWFAKIAPYNVAGFYALSVEDLGRFGITGVTSPPLGTGGAAPGEVPELVTVDWTRLEADRPAVRLYP